MHFQSHKTLFFNDSQLTNLNQNPHEWQQNVRYKDFWWHNDGDESDEEVCTYSNCFPAFFSLLFDFWLRYTLKYTFRQTSVLPVTQWQILFSTDSLLHVTDELILMVQ